MSVLPTLSQTASELLHQMLAAKDASPKLKSTLEKARKACDVIEQAGGKMNFRTIAKIGTDNFGGPSYSTIANTDAKAKPYVDLRIAEYAQKQKKGVSQPKKSTSKRTIDTSTLDPVTSRMVHDLQQRNQMLEEMLKDLKDRALMETRKSPHRTAEAIALGVDPATGGLAIPERKEKEVNEQSHPALLKSSTPSCPNEVLEVVRRLLTLIDPDDPLKNTAQLSWDKHHDHPYLLADQDAGKQTLISPRELPVIAQWLEGNNND